jgi:pimeloyl-ACP methyl ester carboxylesterase
MFFFYKIPYSRWKNFFQETNMASTEGYITIEDGVRLFFRKTGRGAHHLVVLNGFYLYDDFQYLAGEARSVVFLDLRNRGRSSYITDAAKLKRGILNEVDDIEAVRRYFNLDQLDLLAHSYAAKTAVLYALNHRSHVCRVVQIGGMKPDESRQYPAHLSGIDTTLQEFSYKAAQLEQERRLLEPKEFCRRFWLLLRRSTWPTPRMPAKFTGTAVIFRQS